MKQGDKIKYYNTSSNKWIDGVIQRIDNITYSIPIFIVLSNDEYERALTESKIRVIKWVMKYYIKYSA